jgi:hypothetical protein
MIGNVFEKKDAIYIYNDKGIISATIPKGNECDDGLRGYTQNQINVQKGDIIYSYNENGGQINSYPLKK